MNFINYIANHKNKTILNLGHGSFILYACQKHFKNLKNSTFFYINLLSEAEEMKSHIEDYFALEFNYVSHCLNVAKKIEKFIGGYRLENIEIMYSKPDNYEEIDSVL